MTTINVTAEHIAKGMQNDCYLCPIALAINDAIPGVSCAVYIDKVNIDDDSHDIPLPLKARDFVAAFDGDQLVEPFSFELDYPAVTS